MERIKNNDPKFSIELIKNIVETSLDLREMIQKSLKRKFIIEIEDLNLQKDYMLLIHKYESEIRNLKNVFYFN